MIFLNLMNSSVLTLYILVLATHYQTCAARYYQTWTSNYNFFGKSDSFNKGLCANSITTQGYECHEFEVRTPNMYVQQIKMHNLQWFLVI